MAYDFNSLMKAGTPDVTPDTKKPAAGLFQELGIFSPSEKMQMQLQQQQAQQAQNYLKQQMLQQAQQMQLAQAHAKASVPTGYNFAPFQAMGGLMNIQQGDRFARQATKPNAPQQMAPLESAGSDAAGISPEKIITEAIQKYPDNRPMALKVAAQQMAALGQVRNDPYLQNIAANLATKAQEADKEQAEIEAKKASTTKTIQDTKLEKAKVARPGSLENSRDAAGNIVTTRQKYDAEGNFIGDEEVGRGPNRQLTTTVDDPKTQTQKGAEYTKFQDLVVNTDATVSSMRDIASNLEKGAAQGWAANAVGLMDNVIGTLQQFKPNATYTTKATAALEAAAPSFKEWAQKTGVNESIWNDLVSNLAKTYNPTGTITEKDITRAAKTVGQNISNPATVAAVLKDAERRSRALVDKTYEYMGEDAKKYSKTQYDHFLQKWTPGAEGSDAADDMNDGAKANAKPSWDNAPAGLPAPKDEKEYDALPAGTKYWNPYLKKTVTKKK